MGIITSSTILKTEESKFHSRYPQIPAERRRAHKEELANKVLVLIARELVALLPREVGVMSILQPMETELRLCEFMKAGRCKESFTALKNCRNTGECRKLWPRLNQCMHAHSNYYQPILSLVKASLVKASQELVYKDILDFAVSEGVLSEEEAALRLSHLVGFWE